MATWIEVMEVANSLQRRREGGDRLDEAEVHRLLDVLRDFHDHVVNWTPDQKPASGRHRVAGSR
jgi:hypothetical protein